MAFWKEKPFLFKKQQRLPNVYPCRTYMNSYTFRTWRGRRIVFCTTLCEWAILGRPRAFVASSVVHGQTISPPCRFLRYVVAEEIPQISFIQHRHEHLKMRQQPRRVKKIGCSEVRLPTHNTHDGWENDVAPRLTRHMLSTVLARSIISC